MMERDRDPQWLEGVRQALAEWYEQGHRDLPWRADRDPYRILVSETMLVQTTVVAVVPFFDRFLRRFPTLQSLAEADEASVLKAWEGLGYYRRARQLQAAAQAIVRDYGGNVPEDLDALRALPGVGRYIAGAIVSFAFNRPAPIIEANTQRVLARWLAISQDLKTTAVQKILWQAAERLVPQSEPGRFNQAFMELGATICTPRAPRCLVCPVASFCEARERGLQEVIPLKTTRAKPLEVVESAGLVVRDGRLLVLQRGPKTLWAGFWEFPTIHLAGADPAGRSFGQPVDLAEGIQRLTGIAVEVGPEVKTLRFGVTRHQVTLTAHLATDLGGHPIPDPGFIDCRFATPEQLGEMAVGSRLRKLADWAVLNLIGPA